MAVRVVYQGAPIDEESVIQLTDNDGFVADDQILPFSIDDGGSIISDVVVSVTEDVGSFTANIVSGLNWRIRAVTNGLENTLYQLTVNVSSATEGTFQFFVHLRTGPNPPVFPGENNPPVFGEDSYTFSDVAIADGTVIGSAVATDADDDDLTYSLTGDDASDFAIDDDGEITAATGLTRDTTYNITANVSDGTDTDTATVTITTTDNNPPDFDETGYTFDDVSIAIHTVVGSISATDDDDDDLTYSLDNNNFAIDADGEITVAVELTLSQIYNMTATVSDGEETDTVPVTVTTSATPPVAEPPVFGEETYTFDDAQVAVDTVIGTLDATDADDNDEDLTYSIDNSFFDIDDDGQITVQARLDVSETYTFTATVSDGELTDTAEITVNTVAMALVDITTEAYPTALISTSTKSLIRYTFATVVTGVLEADITADVGTLSDFTAIPLEEFDPYYIGSDAPDYDEDNPDYREFTVIWTRPTTGEGTGTITLAENAAVETNVEVVTEITYTQPPAAIADDDELAFDRELTIAEPPSGEVIGVSSYYNSTFSDFDRLVFLIKGADIGDMSQYTLEFYAFDGTEGLLNSPTIEDVPEGSHRPDEQQTFEFVNYIEITDFQMHFHRNSQFEIYGTQTNPNNDHVEPVIFEFDFDNALGAWRHYSRGVIENPSGGTGDITAGSMVRNEFDPFVRYICTYDHPIVGRRIAVVGEDGAYTIEVSETHTQLLDGNGDLVNDVSMSIFQNRLYVVNEQSGVYSVEIFDWQTFEHIASQTVGTRNPRWLTSYDFRLIGVPDDESKIYFFEKQTNIPFRLGNRLQDPESVTFRESGIRNTGNDRLTYPIYFASDVTGITADDFLMYDADDVYEPRIIGGMTVADTRPTALRPLSERGELPILRGTLENFEEVSAREYWIDFVRPPDPMDPDDPDSGRDDFVVGIATGARASSILILQQNACAEGNAEVRRNVNWDQPSIIRLVTSYGQRSAEFAITVFSSKGGLLYIPQYLSNRVNPNVFDFFTVEPDVGELSDWRTVDGYVSDDARRFTWTPPSSGGGFVTITLLQDSSSQGNVATSIEIGWGTALIAQDTEVDFTANSIIQLQLVFAFNTTGLTIDDFSTTVGRLANFEQIDLRTYTLEFIPPMGGEGIALITLQADAVHQGNRAQTISVRYLDVGQDPLVVADDTFDDDDRLQFTGFEKYLKYYDIYSVNRSRLLGGQDGPFELHHNNVPMLLDGVTGRFNFIAGAYRVGEGQVFFTPQRYIQVESDWRISEHTGGPFDRITDEPDEAEIYEITGERLVGDKKVILAEFLRGANAFFARV